MGRRKEKIEYKTPEQISFMRIAALVVNDIHEALRAQARPGVSLAQLDKLVAEVTASHDARSNFFGYYGYPAHACMSVNDTVVHGIPDDYVLRDGDLVSFDCGAYIVREGQQWHGDSAFSMIIGDSSKASARARALDNVTWQAMSDAIAALDSGKTVGCVGEAVERVVEETKKNSNWEPGIVEEFIGHGIGTAMHQPPDVLNYRTRGRHARLEPGMVLCIEPILTEKSADVYTLDDEWTVKTRDHGLACHWECQVAILQDGICVLNHPDCGERLLEPYGIKPVIL